MDNTLLYQRSVTQDKYLQYRPTRSLDTGVLSTGMNLTNPSSAGKFNEKELMRGLNDRLAGFIEKVHHLENKNHMLEREIAEVRGKAKPASRLEEEYGPELRRLRQLVQDITHQKHQIEIEHQNLEEELSDVRRQQERETRGRSDAESTIVVLKKDISDAYQAKLQLDKKAQALVDEISFLKRNHEAEVSEMCDQILDAQVTVKAREFGNPGVTAALRDIRAQLEGQTVSDVRQVGETFRSQFARLTEAAESKREALKATQLEIQEYRRRLQAKSIELDCAKGTKEAMERQLHDAEDRHKEEMIHYQNTIKELENELINCKFDMSSYLREYQDLLNVKMALDVEILSYRKLLCGEEARLSTISDTHISLPYIYHQSPVYTLPCLSRPGGPHRRAEPQYKFVEEIITETTREIEMSEFEETGSETEVEKDEQEGTKRDKAGSEEEMDNKDSREEEGEQMFDGEQNQVGNLVHGGDDGTPEKVDDGEKRTSKEESEETEAVDSEGHGGIDKNIQKKVLVNDEEENEQYQEVAENTKEKEAAVTKVTVQKDLSSKLDDLKSEVSAEDALLKKSVKKGDSEKDGFISAQVKKPVDETPTQVFKESDTTQELSCGPVQDKVPVSETTEKTAEITGQTKTTLSIETLSEKARVPLSTTPKREEKEGSHAEPRIISKSEAVKGENKVAIQDSSNKCKEFSLKSDVKRLPEVEDQKPVNGDKTQTVQTMLPGKKTTVNAEIKEMHQGKPEGTPEASQTIKDPQGKTERVESSKSEK